MKAFEAFPYGGFRITNRGGDVPPVPQEYKGELLPPAELPGLEMVEKEDTEFDTPFYSTIYCGIDPETGEDMWERRTSRGYGLDNADHHRWNTCGGDPSGSDPGPCEGDGYSNPEPFELFHHDSGFHGFLTRGKEERVDRFLNLISWIQRQTTLKNLSKGYWTFRGKVDKIYKARRKGGDPRLNAEMAGKLTSTQIRTVFAVFKHKHTELNARGGKK